MDRSSVVTAGAGALLVGVLITAGMLGHGAVAAPVAPAESAVQPMAEATSEPQDDAITEPLGEQVDDLVAAVDALAAAATAVTESQAAVIAAEEAAAAAAAGEGSGGSGYRPLDLPGPPGGVRTLPVYASNAYEVSAGGCSFDGPFLHEAMVRWNATDPYGASITQPWFALVTTMSWGDFDAIVLYRAC